MRVERKSGKNRKIMFTAVAFLVVFFAVELVLDFLILPGLTVKKIYLDSDLEISDPQLMEMLGINNLTWTFIDVERIKKHLESYPVVKKVDVEKIFPDTLKLFIFRRKPVAVVLNNTDKGAVPAVFDEDGYIVQTGVSEESVKLPIISGISFTDPAIGARMPEKLCGILSDLSVLQENNPWLFSLISEIKVIPESADNFNLKLYLNSDTGYQSVTECCANVPVIVDNRVSAESIRRALFVLDVLSSAVTGPVADADIRGGHVVFRLMEDSDG